MIYNTSFLARRAAMSLIEVLLIITVIGAITAITVPMMGNLKDQASSNSAKRTAQVVASTAENARIAGDLTIPEAGGKEEALSLISTGVEGSGAFEGVRYRVNLTESQRAAILPYLDYEGGSLIYDGTEVD